VPVIFTLALTIMHARLSASLVLALAIGCTSAPGTRYVTATGELKSRQEAEAEHARGAAGTRVDGNNLDAPLIGIATPFPEYPRSLRGAGITGVVLVQFTIEKDGRVTSPTVLGSPPQELVVLVCEAVARWRFEPPMRNGQPTRIVAQQQFKFEVQ